MGVTTPRTFARRFVLATLTHYVDGDAWAFELFANDSLSLADGGAERLSKSSRAGGADLLGTRELDENVEYLEKIHSEFTGEQPGASKRAVDVEFLLEAPSRKIRIVQARPYTMTWSGGRRGK